MRLRLTAAALFLTFSPVFACNSDLINVTDWSASREDRNFRITVDFTSNADQEIILIDGDFEFKDALGETLILIEIDPDADIPTSVATSQTGLYLSLQSDRITQVEKEYTKVTACIKAVQYTDGTIERFDNAN